MIFYEDKAFPANQSSLGMSTAQTKDVKWLRIGTLLKTEKLLANQSASINGLVSSGNFALAINLLHYETQNSLFAYSKKNSKGCHIVVMYLKNGNKKFLVIDDFIPCSQSGSLLFLAAADQSAIGPSLIQKAFAKLCGDYKKANS